jgi:FkbM family methyltransferase
MDKDTISAAIDACSDHDVAIDVGAHIGVWSRPLSERFNRVEAFEPNAEMRDYFAKNVTATNVVLHPFALGASKCEKRLVDEGNSGQCYLDDGVGVTVLPLDSLKQAGKISLIKIDTEGMDIEVIRGAEATIKRHKPVVVIEENICARRYGFAVGEARLLLESFGMKVHKKIGCDAVMTWR